MEAISTTQTDVKHKNFFAPPISMTPISNLKRKSMRCFYHCTITSMLLLIIAQSHPCCFSSLHNHIHGHAGDRDGVKIDPKRRRDSDEDQRPTVGYGYTGKTPGLGLSVEYKHSK